MKLSDVKGERTLEVVADLIGPICNIAQDENAAALFHREKLPKGMPAKNFLLERVKKSAPRLLKDHKSDMVAILAAIEGVTPEEYEAGLNLVKLMSDFVDLVTDEAFGALFISAQSETSSGSARGSTRVPEASEHSVDT